MATRIKATSPALCAAGSGRAFMFWTTGSQQECPLQLKEISLKERAYLAPSLFSLQLAGRQKQRLEL